MPPVPRRPLNALLAAALLLCALGSALPAATLAGPARDESTRP